MYRISGFVMLEARQMPAEVNALNPTSLAAVLRARLAEHQVYYHCGSYYNPSIRVFKNDRVGFSIGGLGVHDDLYAIAFRMDVHSQRSQTEVAAIFTDALINGLRQFQVRATPEEIAELIRRGGNHGNISIDEVDERTASNAGQVDFSALRKPNFTHNANDFQSYFTSQSLASLDMQNRGLISDAELPNAASLPVGCQRPPPPPPPPRPQPGQSGQPGQMVPGGEPPSPEDDSPTDQMPVILVSAGIAGTSLAYLIWKLAKKS